MKKDLTKKIVFCALFILCLFIPGVSGAATVQISNAYNVATTDYIYITVNDSAGVGGFTLKTIWDPTVMNVTSAILYGEASGFSTFITNPVSPPFTAGTVMITSANAVATSPGNVTILRFTCNALVNDGSTTNVSIDTTFANYKVKDGGTQKQLPTINGSFRTIDVIPPVVTITTPLNGDTVSQDINVTADITDKGGVNATSIAVTIDGVSATILNTSPITNGYRINATRTGVALSPPARSIVVSAQDISANANSSTVNVNVAESGIHFDPNLNGTYTNSPQPFINALFVEVDASTIKMFINNTDVTAFCSITSGTSGNISYNLTVPDGSHSVIVNGTSSLGGGGTQTATETFTKDTIKPLVVVNSIKDSDGDGYAEASELLTITYNVTDANPYMVGIGTAWNTSAPTGTLFYSSPEGNLIGNLNKSLTAIDRAINTNDSAPFHIYNNYLAYLNDPSLGSLAGLNLTNTSLYDIFDYANAITIYGPPSHMEFPKLGTFQKTMIGGPNVTFDNRKDQPILNTSLPTAIDYYPIPTGTQDFKIQVANITNATILIAKANSTLLNQLLQNPSKSTAASVSLGQMLAQDTIVMYGRDGGTYGYAIINATDPNNMKIKRQVGGFTFYTSNLAKTIIENAVDISSGFNTSEATGLSPLSISDIGNGEFVILAMSIDYDRVSIITLKTFEVTQYANILDTTAVLYDVGNPVIVNSTVNGNQITGIIVKDSPLYTGFMEWDFTTIGTGSLKNMTLYADGNTSVKKLIKNIYVTEGFGNYKNATNATSVGVPTGGLFPGTYRVYMLLENGGNLSALGQTTIILQENTTVRASFTATPNTTVIGIPVTFYGNATGLGPYSWNWNFGSGATPATSTNRNETVTYSTSGTKTVTLTVNNAYKSNTSTQLYNVTDKALPIPRITSNATTGFAPLVIGFSSATSDVVNPLAYVWQFNDTGTSILANPIHTFNDAGYYDISLSITNASGTNTTTAVGYIRADKKIVPVVTNLTANSTYFSVNRTGNEINYTYSGSNIYLANISGFSQINVTTLAPVDTTGGNLSGFVSTIQYILKPVVTNLAGQQVTVQPGVTGSAWNASGFDIGISFTDAAQDADYQTTLQNAATGATGYRPFAVLNITTSGSSVMTNSVLNISVPYTWYLNYTNAGPTVAGQNFTYVMWTHGTPATTTALTPVWGPTDLPNKWFTVTTTGWSAFGMIGATAKSSSPPSPPSPSGGGGGGGGSGTYTGKIVTYGVPAKPGLTEPAVTKITPITSTGVAESGPVVADLVGMEGVSGAWSVDITKLSGAPASISTSIIQQPSAAVQNSFRTALQATKLDVAQIAYVMQVTKNNISSTGPATVSMSVPQNWINNYGGIDAVRIIRNGDDGSTEVLTTKFSNYDMDTGYLNFKAPSPKGLSTFGIVAVKTYVPGAATPSVTPVVTTTGAPAVTPVQPAPGALPTTTIIGAIIVVIVIIGIGVYFYTRKHD